MIGLNLCRNFIAPQPYQKTDPRPSIDQALEHVEHICAIAGHREAVGPESIGQENRSVDSGLAPSARPGMTRSSG